MNAVFIHKGLQTWLPSLALCLTVVLLLASGVAAQTAHHTTDSTVVPANGQPSPVRGAAIRKNGRFLGWKFAALFGQNTKKWQRKHGQDQYLPQTNSVHDLVRPTSNITVPSGFANAGFLARPRLPAGYIPTAITNGDFNEDGNMDFAISNGGDNTIYVFLGNGDGTFKVLEILYTQGQSPNWITTLKLRKNGHVDLAVTDGDSNTVEVFLGNGDGTFQPSTQTSLPQIPTFILAADVNNDGNQDLVVGLLLDLDATEPQIEVLLGNGAGGFSGSIFSDAISISGEEPVPTGWIAAGDLNNDGYIDFVTTVTDGIYTSYLNHSGTGLSFVNFFGYGDDGPDLPLVVGLGDMDEDGCLDAVRLGDQDLLSVAKGSCDGNFAMNPTPTAIVGDFDPAIQVVDVNGDGHLDVVGSAVFYNEGDPAVGAEGGYLVSVLMGDGKGNLSVAQTYRGGTDAYSLIVADFNGDNRPEILTADSLENQVSLFVNDGSGHYGPPQGATIGYTSGPINAPDNLTPIEVADLNGDGKPDLLLIEFGPRGGLPQLTALLNDGTGKFLPPVRSPITVGAEQPFAAFISGAFRNSAKPDVVYLDKYTGTNSVFPIAFFAGNGDGSFDPPVTLATPPNPENLVAGDFNNDGKLDFAVVGTDTTGEQWEFDIFLGHGDGTFTQLPPQLFPMLGTQPPQQLFALDLNHDGKLDLLMGLDANIGFEGSGDDLIEVLGNGDGTFQTPTILIPHFGSVAVADANHDGYPDLIQNRDPSGDFGQDGLFYEPGVTVYLGSADGTFQQQPSYDLPGVTLPSFNPALVGDFNGDGIPDIATRYWAAFPPGFEARLAVLQGVGDGTFIVTGHSYQLQATSYPLVGGDFNGDGATDLVDVVGLTSSFTTIPAAPAPALDIALDSNPVFGNQGKATITLDLPAASSETVTLSASDPAIQLPASVQFNAGQQTQDVSFTLGSGFDVTHVFALYATLGPQTAVAYGSKPNPNAQVGVTAQLSYPLTPNSTDVTVEPGETFEMFFGITSLGGYSGTFSSLKCMGLEPDASCSFAATSMPILPGGSGSVGVTISTSPSTPFGRKNVTVSGTDGFVIAAASFRMGVGDFSLGINPTTVVLGPTGTAVATLSSTSTFGLNEQLSFVCNGLPAAAHCGPQNTLYTSGPSTGFSFSDSQLAAKDYLLQIVGTADIVSHTISALLRVGDFTATLDKTRATLSSGQSAIFNLTLASVNHYTSSITVSCDSPMNSVTCGVASSPVALTDDGTATVQLTIADMATAHKAGRSLVGGFLVACFSPLFLGLIRRKVMPLAMIAVAALTMMISCGGGGGGTTPPPPPQTVNISVVAQAATTQSDSNNQKTLGPIVITLN
jgi:FG-GAP-like repeat